ncbi:hypothetical protein Nmel_001937 [Mimus melanotis]
MNPTVCGHWDEPHSVCLGTGPSSARGCPKDRAQCLTGGRGSPQTTPQPLQRNFPTSHPIFRATSAP